MNITKILGAIGVVGALWYLTPILDLLEIFAMVCVVPLIFLSAVGIIGDGVFMGLMNAPQYVADFKAKIEREADGMRNAA